MKSRIVALVIMLGIAGPGEAGFYTGSRILASCESGDETEKPLCDLYLGGIVDTTELWVGAGLMPNLICMPGEVSMDRLREVFIAYAKENPGELDEVASATVLAAFLGAFPCE